MAFYFTYIHHKGYKIYIRACRLYIDYTYIHICANVANFALHDIGIIMQNLF